MKICYANDGMSLYDHIFLKFFIDRDHETHLITFYPSGLWDSRWVGLPNYDALKIHHFDTSKLVLSQSFIERYTYYVYHTINSFILSSLVRKIKPDILNGHWLTTYGFYSAMTFYHPLILTVWGSDILVMPKKSYLTKKMVAFALRKADSVIVNSIIQENVAIKLGCDPYKIVRFPWAVNLNKFNPRVSGKRIREELGWEEKTIIFFARWHETIYGLDYLLRAVSKVVENNPAARFVIGGVGSLTEGYKQYVKDSNVFKYVKFVGKIPYSEMPEFMAACDVYVSPSLSDGTSATLLEAMACEKPVVVSDIPGNNEWIRNGENGLVVPTRNSSAIASAIITLVNDKKLRITFGRRSLQLVRKKADLQKSLIKYEEAMLGLIK